MLKIYYLPLFLALVATTRPQDKESTPRIGATSVIAVDTQMHEWLNAYLDWAHHHPSVLKRDASGDRTPLSLEMPYIELFDSTGKPLYRGGNDKQNAAFIDSLQHEIPSKSTIVADRERPSLQEYLDMLSGLRSYEARVLADKKPVLFAVTYRDNAMCKEQNAAIDVLKRQNNIQIVEIDLIH